MPARKSAPQCDALVGGRGNKSETSVKAKTTHHAIAKSNSNTAKTVKQFKF